MTANTAREAYVRVSRRMSAACSAGARPCALASRALDALSDGQALQRPAAVPT